MTRGLPGRRGTRVAVAALVAALGLAASGSTTGTRTANAQAVAGSGASGSSASGSTTIEHASVDSMAAAAAQPPIDDAGYQACADIATTKPTGLAGPYTASAQVAGWADAGKLDGSLPLGYPSVGLAQSESGTEVPAEGYYDVGGVVGTDGIQYQCAEALLQLDYAGQREFPPVTATFLEYGSIPVTATAYLVQDGSAPLKAVTYQETATSTGVGDGQTTYLTLVTTSQVSLRVAQVEVDGVALDVGSSCQTTGAVYTQDPVLDPGNDRLILSGGNAPGEPEPREQQLLSGGEQTGLATIPPFTGCVTPSGENLDALLDSSLSGPGNYVSVTQGPLCAQNAGPGNCTAPTASPPVYAPLYAATWTVSHGGSYSASATLTMTQRVGVPTTTFTCPDAAVSGVINDSAGPTRGLLGTFRWPGMLQCTSNAVGSYPAASWTITQVGTASLEVGSYDSATQTTNGMLDDLTFDVQGPGCTAQLTGALPVTYSNATGTLALLTNLTGAAATAGAQLVASSSTCAQLPIFSTTNNHKPNLSASYPLGSGTTITSP